jgi:hypothetical protein
MGGENGDAAARLRGHTSLYVISGPRHGQGASSAAPVHLVLAPSPPAKVHFAQTQPEHDGSVVSLICLRRSRASVRGMTIAVPGRRVACTCAAPAKPTPGRFLIGPAS